MKRFLLLPLLLLLFLPAHTSAGWMSSYPESKTAAWALGDSGVGNNSHPSLRLLRSKPSSVFFYLGDVYETGTAADFQQNYGFRPLARKTVPTIGNHEWENRFLGYYPFWESLRGSPPPAYYSFRVSGWQVLLLASEDRSGGSLSHRQISWLRKKSSKRSCRILVSHRPRWSAGKHSDSPYLEQARKIARPQVWLSGHDHNMQHIYRNKTHQFVSGAAGRGHYHVWKNYRGLRFANTTEDGALRIHFYKKGTKRVFFWRFFSVSGNLLGGGRVLCSLS